MTNISNTNAKWIEGPTFWKSGHWPTLILSFLYFDFCFAIWVLNGAMAPFISTEFGLSYAEKGFMISVPIISGALMRFPLGILAQYIGRKSAALLEMGVIMIALAYGYFFVNTYQEVLIMGVMLGIAGASFGVALSLGGGWYPPKYKGLAIGIAGAGNSGAIIAMLLAPPFAITYGWQNVYGYAIFLMLIPFVLMFLFAKEPPDREKKTLKDYLKIVIEKDAWVFNISYILTFGGYIGFTSFLPTFFHDQYGIPKSEMGQYASIIIIMASVSRVAGGLLADKFGGINVMLIVFGITIIGAIAASTMPAMIAIIVIFIIIFIALGLGNGATFQLVPLRWPATTAIAMSLIGEIGALGGGMLPNIFGSSKQYFGTYGYGFLVGGGLAIVMAFAYLMIRKQWTGKWIGKGGKALPVSSREHIATIKDILTEPDYNTILCPLSGNKKLIDKAIEQAAYIGKATGSKIILLHVIDKWRESSGFASGSHEWDAIRDEWTKEGKEIIEKGKKGLEERGIKDIELLLNVGSSADEILKIAREKKSDLIVMTTMKYSPKSGIFTDSVIDKVSKHSPCPILWVT